MQGGPGGHSGHLEVGAGRRHPRHAEIEPRRQHPRAKQRPAARRAICLRRPAAPLPPPRPAAAPAVRHGGPPPRILPHSLQPTSPSRGMGATTSSRSEQPLTIAPSMPGRSSMPNRISSCCASSRAVPARQAAPGPDGCPQAFAAPLSASSARRGRHRCRRPTRGRRAAAPASLRAEGAVLNPRG